MNRQNLLVSALIPAIAALALAACSRQQNATQAQGALTEAPSAIEGSGSLPASESAEAAAQADAAPVVAYADVLEVKPVTREQSQYATVIGNKAISESSTVPKEVCADVTVEERQPERDGNVGGTVAGAVVGGALGNQVGKGDGRKLATVAGAVIGGLAGREIDKRHEGGKVVTRTEQQCHTEQTSESRVIGYDVSYRRADGSTFVRRAHKQATIGSRIADGSDRKTIGYDVTYRYEGQDATVRMDRKPGDRLPVIDGQVVTETVPVGQQ